MSPDPAIDRSTLSALPAAPTPPDPPMPSLIFPPATEPSLSPPDLQTSAVEIAGDLVDADAARSGDGGATQRGGVDGEHRLAIGPVEPDAALCFLGMIFSVPPSTTTSVSSSRLDPPWH